MRYLVLFFLGDSIVWFSGVNFVASIVLQCQKVAMPASLSQGTKSEWKCVFPRAEAHRRPEKEQRDWDKKSGSHRRKTPLLCSYSWKDPHFTRRCAQAPCTIKRAWILLSLGIQLSTSAHKVSTSKHPLSRLTLLSPRANRRLSLFVMANLEFRCLPY